MTETAIGTAKMNLTLDTSDYSVALERAKQQQAGLGQVAQQEAEKMTRAQRQVVTSLDNQIAKLGLTREQWLQYKVITQTTGETQQQLLTKIKANTVEIERQGAAAQKTANQVNQYGLTAKQQTAAMRQVPAQMTDIFVSLQGGQNPLTVLLQQGGQLKDVFGGIVPAARALGGALLGLVNPYTVTAALVTGLAVAAYKGAQENNAYAIALAKTGDVAGITAGQMEVLALQLSGVVGIQYKASAALAAVAESGKFTGVQFGIVAEAAVRMESVAGQSIDKTIDKFASLAQEPVASVAKLNQEVHFLTNETFQQIKALEEQGRTQDAATLAMQAYADAVRDRTDDVRQNLGLLESAWKNLGLGAKWAWDQMMDIGRADSRAERIRDLHSEILDIQENTGPGFFQNRPDIAKVLIQQRRQEIGRLQDEYVNEQKAANRAAAQQEADDYAIQQDRNIAAHRGADERRAAEIARSRKESSLKAERAMTAGDKELAAAIRANQQKYETALIAEGAKKNNGSAARSLANAEANAALQVIKNQEDTTRAEIANTSKVLQAEYSARLVTTADYYAKQRDLVTRDFAAQEQSLTKQIEYLRSRDVAGKDSVNVTKQISELEARLAKIRADGATQLVILGIQEQDVAAKRKRAVDAYKESLDTANEASRQQVEASLARIIMGQREAEQQEKLAAILADSAEKQRQLAREYAETNDYAAYQEKLQALRDYTEEQVRIVKDGYDRMREAEGDWLNGLKGGLAQWMEGASNVAEQTNAITQRSLDGAVDMLTNFAMTGKLTWKDLLRDIGEQIVKFMMKQAVLGFIKYFMGAFGWGGGDTGGIWSENTSTTGFGGVFAAKGGAFPGTSGLSNYSGKVVNKPTPFYFAKGAGVMGEAGWEGIFPLQRDGQGNLGVRALGGGGGGPVYVTTQVTVNSDGSSSTSTQTAGQQAAMYRELANNMSSVAQREIGRALMPGGLIWKARGG